MTRLMRRFWAREDGSATVEVALLFPVLMAPFLMAMEAGYIQMRQAMLERAMDIVVRDLRLGTATYDDPEDLKQALCDEILIISDCSADIMLEMGPVQVADFTGPEAGVACVDRGEEINPVTEYAAGSTNELMMLRFCILHDPIMPTVGLGKLLPQQQNGGFPLTATTFFVNEPR